MSSGGRKLTAAEMALAQKIFGTSIEYSKVQVYNKKYWALQGNNYMMTPNGNISAPGTIYQLDYSLSSVKYDLRSLFIHEMVHVWQYQLKVLSVKASGIFTGISTFGQYHKAYSYDLDATKDLLDYSMERQGAIIEDYFRISEGRSTINPPKTTAASRSKSIYLKVLAKFLNDPAYAKGYMNRFDDEDEF